jgi:hypothetical protein
MGHHAHHVAAFVADPGDIAKGAVRVIDISQHHALLRLQHVERAVVGEIAAFAVSNGHLEELPGSLDAQRHIAANELQASILEQRAWEQSALDQDLKAVADAEDGSTVGREFTNRRHHWRKLRDGAAPQVVSIRESAGQNYRIDVTDGGRIVPKELGLLAQVVGEGVPGIVIAIAAGKNDNADFHGEKFQFSKVDESLVPSFTVGVRFGESGCCRERILQQ